jgi:hypothetical protein
MTLIGGEHLLGTLTWNGEWKASGEVDWVFDYVDAVLPAGVEPVRIRPADGEDFLFCGLVQHPRQRHLGRAGRSGWA